MRFLRALAFLIAAAAIPVQAPAAPQPFGTFWTDGKASVEIIPCTPNLDDAGHCLGIALRHDGKLERLGEGYIVVDLVWRNLGGAAGPDVVVRGHSGGSAGHSDILAIDLSHGLTVRKLSL